MGNDKAGFTGTRSGLSAFQRLALLEFLAEYQPLELHHGDCVGADAEAHLLCKALQIPVVIHPPDVDKYRAFCDSAGQVRNPKPYLDRNKDIVAESGFLVACPREEREQWRSGTWMTVRWARRVGRPVVLLFPDGRVDNPLRGW